eukprot:2819105-Prymnesium_polylepis.2
MTRRNAASADRHTAAARIGKTTSIPFASHLSVYSDPVTHRFVLAPVLGLDRVDQWSLSPRDGKLTPNPSAARLTLPSGFGPRHLAFSPADPKTVLLANEGGAATPARVTLCTFDSGSGTLTAVRTLSALPAAADPTDLYPAE